MDRPKMQFERCAIFIGVLSSTAFGVGATRELPNSALPGATITVTISIDTPTGTSVVAAEDAPPAGWSVSNISNSGVYDQQTGKVKWGLFFAPSIPASLSYQVTTTAQASPCFTGLISFDGLGSPISGDSCTVSIPAISTWGMVVLSILLLNLGTAIQRRTSTEEEGFEPP